MEDQWLRDVLVELRSNVKDVDAKVDSMRESQIRTETILREGKFGERIAELEKFRERSEPQVEEIPSLVSFREQFEGAMTPIKFAVGGSLIAILGLILNVAGVI